MRLQHGAAAAVKHALLASWMCVRSRQTLCQAVPDVCSKRRAVLPRDGALCLRHPQVVVQITQNLSSRIRNKHAFELPSLYIPDKASTAASKIDNILEKTCDEMEHTINQ